MAGRSRKRFDTRCSRMSSKLQGARRARLPEAARSRLQFRVKCVPMLTTGRPRYQDLERAIDALEQLSIPTIQAATDENLSKICELAESVFGASSDERARRAGASGKGRRRS